MNKEFITSALVSIIAGTIVGFLLFQVADHFQDAFDNSVEVAATTTSIDAVKTSIEAAKASFGSLHKYFDYTISILLVFIAALIPFFHSRESQHKEKITKQLDGLAKTTREIASISDTRVRIVDPGDKNTYSDIFKYARTIYAYNPPLSLLLKEDPSYRNIIFNNLLEHGAKFNIIFGKSAIDNINKLANLSCTKQYNKSREKIGVFCYPPPDSKDFDGDLHSTVNPWGLVDESDYRGVSFFLIETNETKKVLMYLWGAPLATEFSVPEKAMLITIPANNGGTDNLYDRYMDVFNRRWGKLIVKYGNDYPAGMHISEYVELQSNQNVVTP